MLDSVPDKAEEIAIFHESASFCAKKSNGVRKFNLENN